MFLAVCVVPHVAIFHVSLLCMFGYQSAGCPGSVALTSDVGSLDRSREFDSNLHVEVTVR